MNIENPNLMLAWLWIFLGFASGMVLGLFFHRENWLGGYTSFKRRMYRLAHISFFGLGTVNLLFWLTTRSLRYDDALVGVASWAFVIGAISMPLCCVVMAQFPKARMLFSIPVINLLLGGVLMLAIMSREPVGSRPAAVAAIAVRPVPPSDFEFRISDFPNPTHDTISPGSQPINPF